ncbi:MAG: hypothetical protein LDL56_08645 [Armatimonadetes bacterium]|uniref:hypothetical protein n=1 Tax=Rubritepida flocculans TaxID=182403 RepID=UPI000485BB5B|nr:hypothetical protein [Rubritepida flocculans]MCA1997283.1 hypothetical protein [Armatimonadota bacterium]
MLRFPNPGSTIDNFVRVYGAAFERLNGRVVDLDDIVEAVVAANLATSSGYMGTEAVARSTREDRSRDPLFNQLKMYAELFRMLGWLHPTPESSLNYTFTLLGKQLVAAGRDYWPLLEECILGISFPTPILAVKGEFNLRPFACLLRVMVAAGGYLARDEMIVGPLSASDDRGPRAVEEIADKVMAARKSQAASKAALAAVAELRRTQVNTLHNYTRWPIAVLRDSGWAEEANVSYRDGRKYRAWALTAKGQAVAARVSASLDLRAADAERMTPDERNAVALLAHYQMLDRAGFDVTPVAERVAAAKAVALPVLARRGMRGNGLLFSPFQALSLPHIAAVFPAGATAPRVERGAGTVGVAGRDDRSHLFVAPRLVAARGATEPQAEAVRAELVALLKRHKTPARAAAAFAEAHAGDTQAEFYPLVTFLFRILGFRSEHSRAGVNYQRWDACVWVGEAALPVEIKSPTEEVFLSTKAVRQALENKVILLSRGGLTTRRELTSLVVGYQLPNERGEMSTLIDDVFKAYGLRLGVIDITALAHLTARAIAEGVTIDGDQLSQLRGFLDV